MAAMMQQRMGRQVMFAHILIVLGLLIALPISKPTLWPLEVWGGMIVLPFVWAFLFIATGFTLWRTHRALVAMYAMRFAVILFATASGAAYAALGLNAFTVTSAVLALHALAAATELRDAARRLRHVRA